MHTIGISHKTRYWQHYCFSNPPEGYRYARMLDIPWHVFGLGNELLAHTKYFFPLRRAELFHTYNSIVANGRPWVIEVESYLPRFQDMPQRHPVYRWALRRLAGPDCRALIFTSRRTLEVNRAKLAGAGIDEGKMAVVYRAVELHHPLPRVADRFTVLFAGNGFYRKGGVELIKAFQRLGRPDARLEIISRLEVDWGIFPDQSQVEWAERAIAADPRITLHRRLSHAEVIDHMRRADVFVGTTFADPFNNTVLEAMGTGLPVICSDVGALPEMVADSVNGWVLPVEGRSSDDIADETAAHLGELMDGPDLRKRMGAASHAIIGERFTLPVRNAALARLYERALGGRPV